MSKATSFYDGALRGWHGLRLTARRFAVPGATPDRLHRMADIDCAGGDTPCPTAVDDSGYLINQAEVLSWRRRPERVSATSVPQD